MRNDKCKQAEITRNVIFQKVLINPGAINVRAIK